MNTRIWKAATLVVAVVGGVATALIARISASPASTERATAAGSSSAAIPNDCASYSGLPAGWKADPHAGMVRLNGGEVQVGTSSGYPDERPQGTTKVEPFWIDRTEVTNVQFGDFVQATGYVTDAEREGGAIVFQAPASAKEHGANVAWWRYVKGTNWRHPDGPTSDLAGRQSYPVVHVTYADASAYARWLGRDLPTESQWEYAAKGNGAMELIERAPRDANGRPAANFWQGVFPYMNTKEDGYADLAPVGCYPSNGFGLVDMIGNVWEWTKDPYRGPHQPHGNGDPSLGALAERRPREQLDSIVIKGGSYLCSADYCVRYRASARYPNEAGMPSSHVGIRTVKSAGAGV